VKKHLMVFCYETPEQLATNPMYGWDDEESKAVYILAECEEAALHWGREVAREFVRALFERSGTEIPHVWRASCYRHWIEAEPTLGFTPEELGRIPVVRIGQLLDPAEPQDSPSMQRLAEPRLQRTL
jgi:hypothetical protein